MSCVASAFDSFRCAYRGVNDSVNDVDVDPSGGCLYAACSSGDVCVWNIQTQKLRVRLRHPQWVNAVRCFPMCNSAASSATSLQPPPAANPAAAAAGRADCDALNADLVVSHDIRWVLTGTEDGVIAVWCPVTYRMQSICRPGRAAITALQLIPETSPCAAEKANASKMEHCTTGARFRRASTKVNDGPAICCAASLRDVYVLRVTTASSELALLYAFQHQGLITALTYVAPSMSLSTPLLVVGQEEGTLCVWNCATWAYHDTMPYPTGEADVTADARDDPTSVHEPVYRLGRVFKTFLYNRRRCNPLSDQAAVEEEAAAAAPVDSPDYIGVVPASVSAEAIDTTHVSPLELIVWSDGGAVEYVSTRKRHVLHRQGPGFVCAAACAWSGPTITPLPAAEPVNTFDNGRAGAATSSTEAASKRSGGAARGSRSASAFSARQYLVMAGFDGRLERYDVTEVLELVKSSGKLV
ncbi:WD domain, G-beta repeat family protein [Leishmania donovani]|uniref:WD domain, G-beta repeat family protein n=1 Tax=Leishmania donovani TaxID=5661 RepID=A0A504XKF5_LEIDO|nr:WD domain, G-beta repeat family protein [Leishmania donovani]